MEQRMHTSSSENVTSLSDTPCTRKLLQVMHHLGFYSWVTWNRASLTLFFNRYKEWSRENI
jgi:hypothetical protein